MIDIFKRLPRLRDLRLLWMYLYIFKLALSFIFVMPFFISSNALLSSSTFSEGLLKAWDMSVLIELIVQSGDALPALLVMIFCGLLIFLVLMQFINGGLYYVLVSGLVTDIKRREFFAECGTGFTMNLKITMFMIAIYLVLVPSSLFFVNVIEIVGKNLVGDAALILALFKLAIILLILLAASNFSDTLRGAATAYPEKNFRELLRIGADFYRPRMFGLLGKFLTTFIPFVVIWLFVEWAALQLIGWSPGIPGIILEFLLFQVASFSRVGQKLWYLSILGRDFRTVNHGRFTPRQVELNFE